MPVFQLTDLCVRLGHQWVLNGISFQVGKGERVCLLGPSGSGKSVLLRTLAGLEQAQAGELRVVGEEMRLASESNWNRVREQIGFMFQHGALLDSLTVAENITLKLREFYRWHPESVHERLKAVTGLVGLSESDWPKLPAQLSGGMIKRVALARVLSYNPEILLFDEPTAGLDPRSTIQIDELIIYNSTNRTVITVTHDLESVRRIATRVILLSGGQLLHDGPADLFFNTEAPGVRVFLGQHGHT